MDWGTAGDAGQVAVLYPKCNDPFRGPVEKFAWPAPLAALEKREYSPASPSSIETQVLRSLKFLPVAGFAILVACAAVASADIIKLKNGETLEGIVKSRESHYVVIQMPNGELGLDAAFVESIDTTKGPKTNDDLSKLRAQSDTRVELANVEREQSRARSKAQATAAEASARRETQADVAAPETATAESAAADRLETIDALLKNVKRSRDREKLRRFLYSYFFGGGVYDPVMHVLRR
jgi:hypothetical protein